MGRKLTMPVAAAQSRRAPDVRRRLGGRASTEPGAGEVVEVHRTGTGLPPLVGVVICVEGDLLHVMTDGTTVRRTQRARVTPAPKAPGALDDLAELAVDARLFGALQEGQRVSFQNEAGVAQEGSLVEKCRFGAIVLCEDNSLVGVGFRKVWPATVGKSAPS